MVDFTDKIRLLPDGIKALIGTIGEEADALKMKAFLVGGFVRDLELKRTNLDLDIAVEGDGICLAERLKKKIGGRIATYERFGTATLFEKEVRIDIATARKEIYKEPAALPQVSFSTLKEDLKRRDFTINAMALSINKKTFGCFIDLFEGLEDIKEQKIRVLHDKSFRDDPTRIFRAIRFEQRLGFRIEEHTEKLIREAAILKMVEKTEKRRIREEFVLIFKEVSKEKALLRIEELYGSVFMGLDPAKKRTSGYREKYS
ncbi:MAG: hypothetical protein ABH862_06095 [Candidatus Omnitrophota bacterium]